MLKKLLTFVIGFLVGVLAMSITVYYLEYHYAMSLLPWILGTAALILVLIGVIAYLVTRRKLHKLQKNSQPVQTYTAPAPDMQDPSVSSSTDTVSADTADSLHDVQQ